MKDPKRPAKKKDTSKTKGKPATDKELSEEQLEHVAGGAVDYFLKIDGVSGESQDTVPTTDATANQTTGRRNYAPVVTVDTTLVTKL
jgi:hypothetical protein